MQVSLVSITESLIKEWEMTPEQLIVYIARVSNPSNQHNTESSEIDQLFNQTQTLVTF